MESVHRPLYLSTSGRDVFRTSRFPILLTLLLIGLSPCGKPAEVNGLCEKIGFMLSRANRRNFFVPLELQAQGPLWYFRWIRGSIRAFLLKLIELSSVISSSYQVGKSGLPCGRFDRFPIKFSSSSSWRVEVLKSVIARSRKKNEGYVLGRIARSS